jgi:ABC-type arginine transport system permease subunit
MPRNCFPHLTWSVLRVKKPCDQARLALGLPLWKVLVYIVGPVAFRRMIPPLGNQFIVSLKDTSLFIVIGVCQSSAWLIGQAQGGRKSGGNGDGEPVRVGYR